MRAWTRRAARALGAIALLVAAERVAAADWYVDAVNGSNGNSGSASAPFKDFYPLNRVLKPGDTAHILPGTYTSTLTITASGTREQPITITGSSQPGKRPKIVVTGNFAVHFGDRVGWIRLMHLDIRSTDKSGIWTAAGAHHLLIANNVVHDCGASGIGSNQADYLTIRNNSIFRNAFTGPDQGSGINLLWMKNYDNAAGFHNVIKNNRIYENANKVFKPGTNVTQNGNGIKIDDTRHFLNSSIGPAYTGTTLIENNVIFNNGGRGVHVFQSDHVVVRTNTVYWNNWDPTNGSYHSGEIQTYKSGDVKVYNNVMYSHGGPSGPDVAFAAEYSTGGDVVADYNLTYGAKPYYFANSTVQHWGSNNIEGDPLFVYQTTDPSLADYRVRPGSPALRLGTPSSTPRVDILGDPRPPTDITVGAYQLPVQ